MIVAVDAALKELFPRAAELEGRLDVAFEAPTAEWAGTISRPTLNLYLYDVREDAERRELTWRREARPGVPGPQLRRAPHHVRLSYLLTCWAPDPEDQHELMWRMLAVVFRNGEIDLGGDPRRSPERARLELLQDASAAGHLGDFWNAVGNRLKPALRFAVTVELDPDQVRFAPPVRDRQIGIGSDARRHAIGGIVTGPGAAGAAVRLMERSEAGDMRQRGVSVRVDDEGRFVLPSVRAGTYVLVAESVDGTIGHADVVVRDGRTNASTLEIALGRLDSLSERE